MNVLGHKLRRIVHKSGILHVETPLGVVNVHVGLRDSRGRDVEAVTLIPNTGVEHRGYRMTRKVQS